MHKLPEFIGKMFDSLNKFIYIYFEKKKSLIISIVMPKLDIHINIISFHFILHPNYSQKNEFIHI